MTIMLELDSAQEARLRDQSEALGLAPTDFLKRAAGLDNPPEPAADMFAGKTLADVLTDGIGSVDSADYFGGQPSDLSTRTGKAFAEMLHEKYTQG
jgi:hypothetical protein